MRGTLSAAVLGLVGLGFTAAPVASAHPPGSSYGTGPHDLAPHRHMT